MTKRTTISAVCLLLGAAPAFGQGAGQGDDSSRSPGPAGSATDERPPRDHGGTGSAAAGTGSARSDDAAPSTSRAAPASRDRARAHSDTPPPDRVEDASQSHEINNTVDGRPGP